MLSTIMQLGSNLTYLTNAVEILAGIIAIAGAFICLYNYFLPILPGSALDRLFDTLKNGKSISTKAEVKYQIKCYVPPKFTCNGATKTIQELQRDIKKSSSVVFITGKPASGKTTTMRNLYCRLSKSYKCVYVQMNSIHNINDFRERVKEQNTHRRSSHENVIAFIDGVDEALSFKIADNMTAMETFAAMYLQGQNSKIYTVFRDCGLNLDSVVISLRSEFLETPEYLEEYDDSNIRVQIYVIQNMENCHILKIYKSLKVLCRLDRIEGLSRHQDGRYPSSLWEEQRYIRRFRKILESTEDSIFHYPLYVRYAYKFMREYWDQWNPYMENLTPESNMAISFRTLLNAIFKWEFHIYYGQKQVVSKQKPMRLEEEQRFRAAMETCLERVVETMPMSPGQSNPMIGRQSLEKILAECAYGEHDHLVIAHCVLSADESGQLFGFYHSTFYEYYLAQYILKKATYKVRKEHLLSPLASENFRQMYYILLCQDQSLNLKLYNSIQNINGKGLNLSSCLKLQKENILEISEHPLMPVIDILLYLPFVSCFRYHGAEFSQKQIEDMMDGDMDLTETGWRTLEAIPGLAPCARVKDLDLHYLPLESVHTLNEYRNLTCLDIRLNHNYINIANDALKQLQGISLEQLYVFSDDGKLCTQIQEALDLGELLVKSVFVETPEFSGAHVEIYRLKCTAEESGQKNRLFVCKRTNLARAKEEFRKKREDTDFQVLKAVFELEADENGYLGLQEQMLGMERKEDATLWNGLTLAKHYEYLDNVDEDENAYQVYHRLEPNIKKSLSELSIRFGYEFGRRLESLNSQRAKDWLIFVNKHISFGVSEIQEIDVKIYLFKACIRCGDTNLNDLKNAIENLIKKSPSSVDSSNYCWFLRTCCAQLLKAWKKGTPPPDELLPLLQRFLNHSRNYAEKESNDSYQFSAIYLQLVYMNRLGDTCNAKALLEDLAKTVSQVDQNGDERAQQARQIQYMEQTLYFLFVSEQRVQAIAEADALLEYPHRRQDISRSYVQYIRDVCASDGELDASADKHRLWDTIWF